MKALLVIPAYNEEESIVKTVQQVISAGYDYIVINDGSTDTTLEVCRKNGIKVLDLKSNLGIGGAVQAGHKYAKKYGYDVDIQFDGDGQHDISFVSLLLNEIEKGNDLVIGSRFIGEEKSTFQSTFMRRLGIRWLSFVIGKDGGKSITDPTSGFRASGKKAIELFCESYPIDYPEPESIVKAKKNNLLISEVPVSMNERQGGSSSIKLFSSMYYMIKVTIAILILKASRR